jgi:predicted  nucleic acid-binding Zn-ribbon protein
MGVREQINILVKLQAIDSEIHTINRMLAGVASKIDKLNSELAEQEAILNKFVTELDETKKQYRSLESNVNSNIPKIEKSKARLSSVKTNKEYQSLLKEIEDLTAINSQFEDQMLECLEQIEAAENRLKDCEKTLSTSRVQVDHEKEKIEKDAEKGREKLEKFQKDWQDVFNTVDPSFMTRFDRVRKQVGNFTIARVVQAVCEGCNMNIPPQMYNELQRCEELMFCPHCQRIIYSDND